MATVNVKTGNRRLSKLAAFLREVPRKRFNFDLWVGFDWDGESTLPQCDTTACALGWATAIPSFRAAGLQLKRLDADETGTYGEIVNVKTGAGNSMDSAMEFFGLTLGEAEYIFTGFDAQDDLSVYPTEPRNVTPKMVARTIERFVKKREKVLA